MLIVKKPSHCTPEELIFFGGSVLLGGQVERDGLERRILAAKSLIFLMQESTLVGVAAVKNPDKSYNEFLEKEFKCKLPTHEFGWVFLKPDYRGLGLCSKLCSVKGPMFATARSSNTAMRKVLVAQGFKSKGEYPSCRDRQPITLFVRETFWHRLRRIYERFR